MEEEGAVEGAGYGAGDVALLRLQVRQRADSAYPQQIKISLKATETDARTCEGGAGEGREKGLERGRGQPRVLGAHICLFAAPSVADNASKLPQLV